MDFELILKLVPIYFESIFLTLKLSLCGVFISFLIGIICSTVSYFKIPVLNKIVRLYIEISRNTPLAIQLFFLYFSLPLFKIKLSSFSCALFGLSFLGGSYMSEAIKSGLESIKKNQIESGLSIGLSNYQLMRYVVFPQAFFASIPLITGVTIFLIKETSVVSIVALGDVMFVTKDIIGMYYCTNEALFMLIISYLIIIFPFLFTFIYLRKNFRHECKT